ncbi:DNA cytosine methyltransferase [Candidatus Poribacteria bacterium]|nr:DNA cytosine methyltransferase [Candidatus Poribacteria bacterium]
MTFASLFTGIGGFDLGLERAGLVCRWQCESDANCAKVLTAQFKVPLYKDVRDITGGEPTADLVCGGFPCQDLSVAGRRKGLAGAASGLWFEFQRVLAAHRPEWVLIENVPGLLSSNGGRDFAEVLSGLEELRYGVAWRVLDSQHFGVPQRRRRVYIVGHLGDGRAASVLFEPQSMSRHVTSRGHERGPGRAVSATLTGNAGGGNRPAGHRGELALVVSSPPVRRFTPAEWGRLQGFPDGWNDWLPDTTRYRQFGNAVTVPVAEWLGRRMLAASDRRTDGRWRRDMVTQQDGVAEDAYAVEQVSQAPRYSRRRT